MEKATSDLINQSALSYLAEESLALKIELYELPKWKKTKGTYRNNFFPVNWSSTENATFNQSIIAQCLWRTIAASGPELCPPADFFYG